MIVQRYISPRVIFYYSWKPILYYILLAISIYLLDELLPAFQVYIPFYTIAAFSTALSIFLGFNNNQAYDRWWEARKIWGLAVNYSRAWTRQVSTFLRSEDQSEYEEIRTMQQRMIYRHGAFIHALRIFLRIPKSYNKNAKEYLSIENTYDDLRHLLDEREFKVFCKMDNPPNYLNQLQGEDLKRARERNWISEFRYMQLDQTLVEFNNIQGRCERIKNTPMPRAYTFFSRVFVILHATLLPFAFIKDLGWAMIPVSLVVSIVFQALDVIGARTQDPFENRMDDTPMSSLSYTIERNLREQWGEHELPDKPGEKAGVIF